MLYTCVFILKTLLYFLLLLLLGKLWYFTKQATFWSDFISFDLDHL